MDGIDMEWIRIERDKYGFATSDALDKMYDSLPAIVVSRIKYPEGWEDIETIYETKEAWERGEYELHTKYTEYLPCPALAESNS